MVLANSINSSSANNSDGLGLCFWLNRSLRDAVRILPNRVDAESLDVYKSNRPLFNSNVQLFRNWLRQKLTIIYTNISKGIIMPLQDKLCIVCVQLENNIINYYRRTLRDIHIILSNLYMKFR